PFFFSSRRRHTRFSRDWSSDVCSSDLDIIEPFADYAFNKSHSYGYGFVAYQTAYLKANYPVEYLACLLTSVKTNLDKAAVYLNRSEERRVGKESRSQWEHYQSKKRQ